MNKTVITILIALSTIGVGIAVPSIIQNIQGRDKPKPRVVAERNSSVGSNTQQKAPPSAEHYSNPEQILTLAEQFFTKRKFEDSVRFYQRYLVLKPGNDRVRAKLGSALTFTGDVDGAIAQLRFAEKSLPSDFQVLAFLSIAYAEKGELLKALEIGEQALKFAPHKEAEQRFSVLINSLKSKTSEGRRGTSTVQQNRSNLKMPDSDKLSKADNKLDLEQFLKNHPMVGSKFTELNSDINNQTLTLTFKDFPMQAMPPFARKKFVDKVKSRIDSSKYKKVVFENTERSVMYKIDMD